MGFLMQTHMHMFIHTGTGLHPTPAHTGTHVYKAACEARTPLWSTLKIKNASLSKIIDTLEILLLDIYSFKF